MALHLLRGAAPDQNGCIAYGSGALPTDRVQRPHSQAQTRIRTPPHAQAMHHPLLRRTTWTDIALLTRQRNAPHLAQHSHSQTQPRRASQPHRAPHPQQGTAPVMWRCTRSERVHCLRIGCIAYGSGAAPTLTSPNADHSTTRANFNTTQQAQHNETTAAPARMADNTPSRTTSPTYRIEDSTLFEYKPHRTRAQTRKHTPNPSPQPSVVGRRKPQKIDSPRPP